MLYYLPYKKYSSFQLILDAYYVPDHINQCIANCKYYRRHH